MDKLEQIDSKLRKLDSIETQLKDMSGKLSQIEDRVSSLESKSLSTNSKLTEIEASRHYDSQTCDEIRRKQSEIDASIRTEKQRNEQASKHIESIRHENKRLSEDLIDMQARSMRDNLIFFNFKEPHTADERRAEDCTKIIVDFCENTLRIPDVRTSVKIDRAHRLGSYINGKHRPIVAKFNYYQDKVSIKRAAHDKREATDIRVSDQYPKAIQDRRKLLIPELIKAKQEGKTAVLNYDKLFIDGRRYIPDGTSGTSG